MCLATKEGDVLDHRILHGVVVRQGRSPGQPHLLDGAALGRPVFLTFLDNDAGSDSRDLHFQCIHTGILPGMGTRMPA